MTKDKEKILDEYISLRSLDCADTSNYKRYIQKFLSSIKNLEQMRELDLINYEKQLSKDFSQTTLNSINPLLKNFVKWYFSDYSSRFPSLDKILKTKKAQPVHNANEMLTIPEIMRIIEFEEDLFWKAFWLVYAYGGYRPIDTARLKWQDFSWEDDGSIVIKSLIGKNKKKFYKHIPSNVAPIIKRWREVNPEDYVFPSPKLKGQHINSKTPANRMSRIAEKVLGRKIIPYIIRKSIATILYQDLQDDEAADAMGHHKSMKETYARLNDEALTKRAKRVWTSKEEMPQKEKEQLQKQISQQNKIISDLRKKIDKQANVSERALSILEALQEKYPDLILDAKPNNYP